MTSMRAPSPLEPESKDTSTNSTPRRLLSTSNISTTLAQARAAKDFAKAQKIWAGAKVILTEEEYTKKAAEFALAICKKYNSRPIVLVSTMEGGAFMGNLLATEFGKLDVGYKRASLSTASYGDGIVSAEKVQLVWPNKTSLEDEIVVVADDIVDTGRTYETIVNFLQAQKVAAFEFVVGINKPHKRAAGKEKLEPSFAALTTDDKDFCGGGGMDMFKGYLRDKREVRSANPKAFEPTPPSTPRSPSSLSPRR